MLKTVLLLDGSSAMNATVDYLPTRLLALKPQVQHYIRTYLDLSPLSQLGTVVMRDTSAHVLSPLTTSATQITEVLELRYFLQGGSGAMSLECGLRTAFSQLVELRTKKGPDRGSASSASQIVLVTSSVSLVDGGDVRAIVEMLKRARIRVDVVHLVGCVYALQQLAEQTGGQHFCPMNYEHLKQIMTKLPYESSALSQHHNSRHHGKATKRERDENNSEGISSSFRDDDGCLLVPLGFPELVPATEIPGKSYLICPRCNIPLQGVPCVCPLCALLVSSLPFIHMSYIWRNHLVPPVDSLKSPTMLPDAGDIAGVVKCSLCDVELFEAAAGGGVSSEAVASFVRCTACSQLRCNDCNEVVATSLGLCPSCVA